MKKIFIAVIGCLAVLSFSNRGIAATPYFSTHLGMSWLNDAGSDSVYGVEYAGYSEKLSFDSGIGIIGACGYDFGAARLEAEIGYQLNRLETYNQAIEGSATARNADGDISILSLMMNSGYDFTIKGTGITPYITAGIGVAQINIDDLAVDSPEPEGKYEVAYSESLMQGRIGGITSAGTIHENTLAYQFGAGIGIPLGNNLTIDGRYRYFATSDFTVSGTNVSLSSNTLLLGLRMEF